MAIITSTQQTEILKVVAGLFNAAPGGIYLTEMANLVGGGMTISQLADALAAHTLFTNTIMAGKVTTEAQVEVLMNNFGLVADSDPASAGSQAHEYFHQQIEAGVGFGQIVYDAVTFLSTTTDTAFTTTATLLANKALVAEAYSKTSSSTDLSALQNVLSNVSGAAPYTAADVAAVLAGSNSGSGQTFTLTDGVDVSGFTGTAGNDTYIASDETYNTGDSLNGSGGTDTLKLTLTAANTALVDLNAVEVVRVRDVQGVTVEASGWDGVTEIWSDRSTENTVVDNVAALAAVGVNQGDGANNFQVNFATAAVEGDADEVTIALTDSDAGTVTVNGVETFNITSGGTSENELVDLTGDATETVNISGAQDLTITNALDNTITTIDGSDATGAIAIEVATSLAGATDELAVTLGTVDDTLNTGAILNNGSVHASATLALDGGDGIDTLAVDAQIDDDVDVNEAITNFEVLQIEADVAYDLDDYDWVEEVNLNANITAGKVIDNIAAGVITNVLINLADVELSHASAGGVGTQSIAVSIGGEAAVTAGMLTIDGVENISVESTGEDANVITAMENDALRVLTITGDQDLDITTENIQDSVVASDFAGELTIDLSAQANAIEVTIGTGGSNITVDAADDDSHAITLGAGAVDTLVVLNPDDGAPANSLTNRMAITGFEGGAGNDVVDFADSAAGAVVTDAELEDIQAAVDALDSTATLTDAFDAAIGAFTGAADDVYFFEFDDSTYVVYEDGTDAAAFDTDEDYVIELVGTGLGLTEDNFVF